jgi:hypothetical protein
MLRPAAFFVFLAAAARTRVVAARLGGFPSDRLLFKFIEVAG